MQIGSFLALLVLLLVGMAFVLGVQTDNSCDPQCALAIQQQRELFNDQREAQAERSRAWNDAIRTAVPPLVWIVGSSIFVLSCGFAWQCFADGYAAFRRSERRRLQ